MKSNVEGTMLVCLIWLVLGNEKQMETDFAAVVL